MQLRGSMKLMMDSIVHDLDFDDLTSARKCGFGRWLVARLDCEQPVATNFFPYQRRTRLLRVRDLGHRPQRIVIDLNRLGGVSRAEIVGADHRAQPPRRRDVPCRQQARATAE